MGSFGILLLAGATCAATQPPPGADYYAAANTAAQEVDRQIDYLQRAYFTTPPIQQGRGLFKQTEGIRWALSDVQKQINQKASRNDLYLSYSAMDAKLKQLLGDLDGLMKLDPALAYASSRLRAADHDLYFALSFGDKNGDRQAQVAYRQTLVLQLRVQDLKLLVGFAFDERATLQQWNADLADIKGAVTALQQLEQNKPTQQQVKDQLVQTDKLWDKLVAKVNALPQAEYFLLRNEVAQVDQVFVKLYGIVGISGRRTPLKGAGGS